MSRLTKEAIADTLCDFSSTQKKAIENCMSTLDTILKSGKITETNLKNLTGVWRELDALRELFIVRLFNSLKRGDMLLD